jgi:hypothetical protein
VFLAVISKDLPASADKSGESRETGVVHGGTMISIKVQYDATQRTFKLVDQNFNILLEGDGLYDLQIPFVYEIADLDEFIPTSNPVLAHA